MSDTKMTDMEAKLGLAPRFDVKVDGYDLGGWQSCSGLEVDFSPEIVQEIGENTFVHYLRGQSRYQQVVLTRAMVSGVWMSDTVQWLQAFQERQQTRFATITLKDAWNAEVATWRLHGILPVKWQGPTLNASSSDVAVEKLTLAHEGFEKLADTAAGVTKASIRDANGGSVTLQFNPTGLSKSQRNLPTRRAAYSQRAGQSASGRGAESLGLPPSYAGWASSVLDLGYCTYSLSNVIFDTQYDNEPLPPAQLSIYLDLLFYWMEKDSDNNHPLLTFSWGGFLKETFWCNLTGCTVKYKRLDPDGTPTRVEMDLTLTEVPGIQRGTNPTSGGPGGQRSHIVVDDESLASVAYQEYGDPSVWPLLAKFNRIDDPARIRAGSLVRVPPIRELQQA
jgi:phage tail-like protein